MEGQLSMSRKERERMKEFSRVAGGSLKLVEAAEVLGMSYRQCQRQWRRYREEGDAGLVHRGRGRGSNRGHAAEVREAVLARYIEQYENFGPTLAAEKLLLDGYAVDHETLRRWLIGKALWKRRRRRSGHRSWRERKHHFGELVQFDGSHHRWFEDRGEKSCLMNMVDDATSTRLAFLSEQETIDSAMKLLWKWIECYGVPQALYTDRKNIYVADAKSREMARDEGREALTQFGRSCRKLGIRIIAANSPQAKGRVERSHGVYQDRMVKEFRLEGISTNEAANRFMDGGYLDELNRRFAVEPLSTADYHRSADGLDLAAIFCIEEQRTLSADWIVRFENSFFQLAPPQKAMIARGKVSVRKYLDGSLHFLFKEAELGYCVLAERPLPPTRKSSKNRSRQAAGKHVPPPNHPWRLMQIGSGTPLQR